jgi:hypothetical protein
MNQTTFEKRLPLKGSLKNATILSWVTAALMAAASLAGILYPASLYATTELQQSSLTNDVISIMISLPILLGSIYTALRGSLLGLLLWPGGLLYVVYNYLVYTFGNPFGWITILSVLLVLISTLAAIQLIRSIDAKGVKQRIVEKAPNRFAGVVMIVFGTFFIVRVAGIIAGAVTTGIPLPLSEIGLAVADVTLSVLWITVGVLLLRRQPLGYLSGLGLLFAASALFIGLLVFFILQPIITDLPFALVDFVVVLLMSLVCFVPFGLYVRAISSSASA